MPVVLKRFDLLLLQSFEYLLQNPAVRSRMSTSKRSMHLSAELTIYETSLCPVWPGFTAEKAHRRAPERCPHKQAWLNGSDGSCIIILKSTIPFSLIYPSSLRRNTSSAASFAASS